jgi:FkbM family methyltransferase
MSKFIVSLAKFSARVFPTSVKRSIYRIKPFAGLIRDELNRSVPENPTMATIVAGELAGVSMCLDLQTEKDYWLGTYEPDLQTAIREFVKPGMVVFDVGANIGYITLLLADAAGANGHVYAFEALPDNLKRLKENISINNLENRITVISAAVADRSDTMRFLVGPSGGMGKLENSAGRRDVDYPESIEVQSICLDDFVPIDEQFSPDVIKIDIEGGEILALNGMHRILDHWHPQLFIEIHGPEAARVTWETLTSYGYQICQMKPGYPQVDALEDLDWKAYIVGLPING